MPGQFTLPGRAGDDLHAGPDRPALMGIVNLTPDSFSDGGALATPEAAVERALRLEAEGAAVLDLGAESSRPGAQPVPEAEELRRLLPVLARLRAQTRLPISIDTTKAAVARAALDLGADWINDITALSGDPEMAGLVAESGAVIVLMHMRGEPKTMQRAPSYRDPVAEVLQELGDRVAFAGTAGIGRDRILVDPGIGFGKRFEDNLALIRSLPELGKLGRPVVLGVSRKSFLGELVRGSGEPPPPESRDVATAALTAFVDGMGVSVHRVHNVRYAMDALRTLRGIGRK